MRRGDDVPVVKAWPLRDCPLNSKGSTRYSRAAMADSLSMRLAETVCVMNDDMNLKVSQLDCALSKE